MLAFVVGMGIVYFIYSRDKLEKTTFSKELDIKKNTIFPVPENFNNNPELINLFFDIREYQDYNPNLYKKVVTNVDSFMRLYKDVKIGTYNTHQHYDTMEDKHKQAMNNMHSFIYSLPDGIENPVVKLKFKVARQKLNKIMNEYLNKVANINNEKVTKEGFNILNKKINKKELVGIYRTNSNKNDFYHYNFY